MNIPTPKPDLSPADVLEALHACITNGMKAAIQVWEETGRRG